MAGSDKPRLLVVCGPTASGKSDLALTLARRFCGELIGADSMQVYRGLTIGTAAMLPEETGGIPQHLVGFLPPEQTFSVAGYASAANQTIREVANRGALPVLCGGTGLYIEAIVNGLRFTEAKPAEGNRAKLEAEWEREGGPAMLRRLAQADPACAEKLSPNDKKRILRALEEYEATGLTLAQRNAASRPAEPPYQALSIGLMYPERAALYHRIDKRVDRMMEKGLLKEARQVYRRRDSYRTAVQAIGYKEFFPFFEGQATLEACVEKLKQATRNYAKRQLTWFRRMPDVHWFSPDDKNLLAKVTELVQNGFEIPPVERGDGP